MGKSQLSITDLSLRLTFLFFALIFGVNVLRHFGVIDFSKYVSDLFSIFGGVIILAEIGILSLRGVSMRKLDAVRMIALVVAGVAIIGGLLSVVNMPLAVLAPIRGVVDGALLVLLIVEAFRK